MMVDSERDNRDVDDSFRRNNLQYKYHDNRNKYDRQPKYPRKENSFNNKSNVPPREYRKNRGNSNPVKPNSTGTSGRWVSENNREDYNNLSSNSSSQLSSKSLEQHDLSMKNKSVERSTTYASSTGSNSSGSNYSSNKENQQNSSTTHSNLPKVVTTESIQPRNQNPFRFEISAEEDDLCQSTNNQVYQLYQSVVIDEELLRTLQCTYMNIHQYLVLQQKNFCDFLEEKRNHEINTWLASMSETEQKRYFERNPSQVPPAQRS